MFLRVNFITIYAADIMQAGRADRASDVLVAWKRAIASDIRESELTVGIAEIIPGAKWDDVAWV